MSNPNSKPKQHINSIFCILCRVSHLQHESLQHMHSMEHHRELEALLGKNGGPCHQCQACNSCEMGLDQYAQHITTAQHLAKLQHLMYSNVKALSLYKTLSKQTINRILQRNKTLKKKRMTAARKKMKQTAGQRRAGMRQEYNKKNNAVSNVENPERFKQVRRINHFRETQQKDGNNAVVRNKENKLYSHQTESSLQGQSRRLDLLPGGPMGKTGHHPSLPDHRRYDDNFSANNQFIKLQIESSQTGRHVTRPPSTCRGGSNMSGQSSWPGISCYGFYNEPYRYDYTADAEFTSDQLPENDCIIFGRDDDDDKRTGPPQPRQEQRACSANFASACTSANSGPIQDVDVSSMLWQIRRALGVREPCRADREARKQSVEASVGVADRCTTQQAGTEKVPPAGLQTFTSAATTSVQTPQVNTAASANPRQSYKLTQGMTQQKSSVVACDPGGPSDCWEISQYQGEFASSTVSSVASLGCQVESNMNSASRVRVAHKPGRVQREKDVGLKKKLPKLLTLPSPTRRARRRQMFKEMERTNQEQIKGMPRFGIESVNRLFAQEAASGPADNQDLLLSEGFHWESVPGRGLNPHMLHPLPTQYAADNDTDTRMDVRLHGPVEQQAPTLEKCVLQGVAATSVKVQPNLEDEKNDLGDNCTNKRKLHPDDAISDKGTSGRKKKTQSNNDQDQMEQLLAVSLREEELSHSLQDLDTSLVQARNALQAAYTEVHRLLLLKQQFTTEVNSLRTKRIEILQGMQEGYSAYNVVEKATTSTAEAADTIQPRPLSLSASSAFTTSSSQQLPATNIASSISQAHSTTLAKPTISVKQEICQPTATLQPSQLAKAASSKTDAPQLPVSQPVPLFPTLLLSPHLAASTVAVTKQLKAQCSTSVNAPPSSESSSKQLEKAPTEESKGRVNTERLAGEEAVPVERVSEDMTDGNLGKKQVKGSAAEKSVTTCVPGRDKNKPATAPEDDRGNESDNSVEMMEPCNPSVIDIDQSDNDNPPGIGSNEPVHKEPSEKSVSVDFCSADSQTDQREVERKFPLAVGSVSESEHPPESIAVTEEEEEEEEPALGAFSNHTGPVHDLQVHEGVLYTCSGDNTARAYSLLDKKCQAVFKGHTNKVNCLLVSSLPNMPARLYTGSSDKTIRCYDAKSQKCLEKIPVPDRVLCLHIAWNIVFVGLANGLVASFDVKTLKQLDVLDCHGPRGVSCLGTAQEGARRVLLVGSYDSTISVRDAKSGLMLRSLQGHTKTVLCMKVVNDLVFTGSSDTSVHAHNIHTGELVRIYKGHGHAVTSIAILGKVMVTACLDKLVRVYELQSHDRLQVYGGHSDMVMCMAIHKSVIYTGCYDGSVQAVKLNLMKNYRCWWHSCSLIFGMAEHLINHLVRDHSSPNQQTVKCRWRGCSAFYSTQESVRQELPVHMLQHVESDSKVQP